MSIVARSFTSVGAGTAISVKHNAYFAYSISGTFVGTIVLERSTNGISWDILTTKTAAASDKLLANHPAQGNAQYRLRCSAYTSGTIVTTIEDQFVPIAGQKSVLMLGAPRVGATAGWVIPTSSNIYRLATCPASQTAATLIVSVGGTIPVGSTIKGFYLLGQIESAGATASLSANLRSTTSAAADIVDASIATTPSLSVTAQTKVNIENTMVDGLSEIVSPYKFYYALITATTAALTDIDLQGIGMIYQE